MVKIILKLADLKATHLDHEPSMLSQIIIYSVITLGTKKTITFHFLMVLLIFFLLTTTFLLNYLKVRLSDND